MLEFALTWSQTNSSSATNSCASGVSEAYLCMVAMRVLMYSHLAAVRDRPWWAAQASLRERWLAIHHGSLSRIMTACYAEHCIGDSASLVGCRLEFFPWTLPR